MNNTNLDQLRGAFANLLKKMNSRASFQADRIFELITSKVTNRSANGEYQQFGSLDIPGFNASATQGPSVATNGEHHDLDKFHAEFDQLVFGIQVELHANAQIVIDWLTKNLANRSANCESHQLFGSWAFPDYNASTTQGPSVAANGEHHDSQVYTVHIHPRHSAAHLSLTGDYSGSTPDNNVYNAPLLQASSSGNESYCVQIERMDSSSMLEKLDNLDKIPGEDQSVAGMKRKQGVATMSSQDSALVGCRGGTVSKKHRKKNVLSGANLAGPQLSQEDEPSKCCKVLGLLCTEQNCKEIQPSVHSLDQHLYLQHHIKKQRCLLSGCGHSFNQWTQLSDHIANDHSDTVVKCHKCDREMQSYKSLHNHFYMFHNKGVFQCSTQECGFVGFNRQEVYKHYRTAHGEFRCSFKGCGKSFGTGSCLRRHEEYHRDAKPYKCKWENCGKAFKNKERVVKHVRMVHFNLPPSKKEQQKKGIVDDRDPVEFFEVVHDEMELQQ